MKQVAEEEERYSEDFELLSFHWQMETFCYQWKYFADIYLDNSVSVFFLRRVLFISQLTWNFHWKGVLWVNFPQIFLYKYTTGCITMIFLLHQRFHSWHMRLCICYPWISDSVSLFSSPLNCIINCKIDKLSEDHQVWVTLGLWRKRGIHTKKMNFILKTMHCIGYIDLSKLRCLCCCNSVLKT